MMKYKIFKIKEGKKEQWMDWCNFLMQNKEAALKTLEEEQVTRETILLSGDYMLYGMEGKCLPSSDCELNRQHRKNFNECLERVPLEEFSKDLDFKMILDLIVDK